MVDFRALVDYSLCVMVRIGVLTGGGDCPGLNAVIRAVTKTALYDYGMEVIGIEDGYSGLIEKRSRQLNWMDVSGILTQGGTILGTSNKANPFGYPVQKDDGTTEFVDLSDRTINYVSELRLDALVAIGGDGTLTIGKRIMDKGVPVVGVPKTIDNDIFGTDLTFGFDSAVTTATEAIDKIHTTAQSHHRVMIVEVMGRNAGWLALWSGIAGGGDIILIPEISYKLDIVCELLARRSQEGKRFSIIVVSEGAKTEKGDVVVQRTVADSMESRRFGGIGNVLADQIELAAGLECRVTTLGHLQRGGTPTAFDRVLATRFGYEAVRTIRMGIFGKMVALRGTEITTVSIDEVAGRQRLVPQDHTLIECARSFGTCFGD